MTYRVVYTRAARKALDDLDASPARRIAAAVEALATNPHPPKSLKLTGEDNAWRIRVGDYRIVYSIEDDTVVVLILRIGQRGRVYR